MKLRLYELLDSITIEGNILIRIWDDDAEDYSFEKHLDDLKDRDAWVYGYPVRYIYPIEDIIHNKRTASVVIELYNEED